MQLEFSGRIWFWKGPAPFYFVTVPPEQSHQLHFISGSVTYGWGMIPVSAEIGRTRWTTSLWPKGGSYIVPLKSAVQKAEGLDEGGVARVRISLSI